MTVKQTNGNLSHTDTFQRVEQYIRHSISVAEYGQRLPSVRELIRQCDASKSVVGRALSRLQGEGLIEARPRMGMFRAGTLPVQEKIIDYLYFGHPNDMEQMGFHAEVFASLNTVFSGQSQFLRLRIMKRESAPQSVIDSLVKQSGGQIITSSIGISDVHYAQQLEQAGFSCLHLLPNFTEPISPSLTLNDDAIVRQQIEHLIALGHRKIAYLHAATDKTFARPVNVRRDVFCRLSMEYELQVKPGWVRYVGYEAAEIQKEVRSIVSEDTPPTALIIYDKTVNPVYAALRACGKVPGRDISVIGCDDMPWAKHVDPPLTTIRVPRIRMAKTAHRLIQKVVAGETVGRQFVDTEAVPRQSTSIRQESNG